MELKKIVGKVNSKYDKLNNAFDIASPFNDVKVELHLIKEREQHIKKWRITREIRRGIKKEWGAEGKTR